MSSPALLIIDVIRAFFDPAGVWWYPEAGEIIAPLEKLLTAARASDRLVVHTVERPSRCVPAPGRAHLPGRLHDEVDAQVMPGFEPLPGRPNEVLMPKRRYSAFFATDLDLLLREHRVESLVVVGVKTNVCLRATVSDAFAHGYEIIVPREATNSNRPHLAEATLEDIGHYFGQVVSLDEALRRLQAPCGPPAPPA